MTLPSPCQSSIALPDSVAAVQVHQELGGEAGADYRAWS